MNLSHREEDFLKFMKARELIRLKRELKMPREMWTNDRIFQTYSFTNVHRFYDRTTQYLYNELYQKNRKSSFQEQIMNAAIFRWFGSADFAGTLGWQEKFSVPKIERAAALCETHGLNVFSGAYIIPACGRPGSKVVIACDVLSAVWRDIDKLADAARQHQSWQVVYDMFHEFLGYGGSGFMAKEALQDALLMPVLEKAHDRYTWTPVGPGGRRGLNRIYKRGTRDRMKEHEAVGECLALHKKLWKHWERWRNSQPAEIAFLRNPILSLGAHDVQFQLCEYDKYQRVKHGQGRPRKKFSPRMS